MKKYIIAAVFAATLMNTGCSVLSSIGGVIFAESKETKEPNEIKEVREVAYNAAVSKYSPDSLRNYKTARDFAANGRYELAREHYLMALASANDPYLQDALAQELESIDMIIKSLR